MRLLVSSLIFGAAMMAPGPRSQEPMRLMPAVAQLVVVDVFAFDANGRPRSAFKAEDFELLEDHRAVAITAFESPRADAIVTPSDRKPGAAAPERRVRPALDAEVLVIYIDRKLLSPAGRRRVIEQSQALASAHLKSGGRVVVIAEDGLLRPLSPVTNDPDELQKAFGRIGELAIQSPGAEHERIVLGQFEAIIASEGCAQGLPQLIDAVRDYARWRSIESQEAGDRLSALVDALVGLPGRKALVYASEGLEQRPGIHLFEQITSVCPEVMTRDASQIFSAMQEVETSPVLKATAARANAARVTFYPIDARGLMSATAMDPSRGDRRFIPTAKNDFIRDANMVNSYRLLAEETGGFPIVRGLSPEVATRRFQSEAAGHYVLAFTPDREADGKAHDITVRLKKERKGVELRHRMSYLHSEPSLQRGQRALSALMFGLEENGLRASVNIQRDPEAAPGEMKAIVRIRVPLDALRFEGSAEGRRARVRVVVALRSNTEPARAAAQIREKEFTIEDPGPSAPEGSTHDVVVEVPIDGSSYDFAVGIEDAVAGVTTYVTRKIGRVPSA